jgi:hypothetical protein
MTPDQTQQEELRKQLGYIVYGDSFVPGHDYDDGEIVLEKLAELITARDERIKREARIDVLAPLTIHLNDCDAVVTYKGQTAYHTDDLGQRFFVGKDPQDCFDYLCNCGALKVIERLAELTQSSQQSEESKG